MKRHENKKQSKKDVSAAASASIDPINRDLMISVLIVSLAVNLFVLIGWVALKVTSAYDSEVAAFLFTR